MQVWAVTFDEEAVSELEEVYQRGLDVLDVESKTRTQRYFRQQDRFRGLIGRLLPRVLLKERGVSLDRMSFSATQAGKPYIATDGLDSPIGYNITHDSGLIAMAFDSGDELYPDPPAYRIGLDVMKIQLPKRDTFAGLIEAVSEQLTPLERNLLRPPLSSPPVPQAEALRRFYLIWTLKEAYTKALGLGLGFNFKRIEYDVPRDVVRIDGVIPHGWKFVRFQVQNKLGSAREDETYIGVAAQFLEGERGQQECVVGERHPGPWLRVFGATEFVENALQKFN